MPVPPPIHDPSHIETRLLVVAEMLERAVAEVRRTMAEIQMSSHEHDEPEHPTEKNGATDGA